MFFFFDQMDNSGRLSKFAEYVNTYGTATGGQLSDTIREVQVYPADLIKRVYELSLIPHAQSGTVFAPSNEAFERLEREMGESEFKRMMEESGPTILGMHFLNQRIPAQDIRISNPQNEIKVLGWKERLNILAIHTQQE